MQFISKNNILPEKKIPGCMALNRIVPARRQICIDEPLHAAESMTSRSSVRGCGEERTASFAQISESLRLLPILARVP